jgi:hypothetical protein
MPEKKNCRAFNTPEGCNYGTDCRFPHVLKQESKTRICKSVLDGFECIYGDGCRFSHESSAVLTTTRLYFKGDDECQAALQMLVEFDSRNLSSEADRQRIFKQYAEVISKMIMTPVVVKNKSTEEKSIVLWGLVAESKLGEKATGLTGIVQYILNDPSLRANLEAKISDYLKTNKMPSFGNKSNLIVLKRLFEEVSQTVSADHVNMSSQLLKVLGLSKENSDVPRPAHNTSAAPKVEDKKAGTRQASKPASATPISVRTQGERHVPAKAIKAILDMSIPTNKKLELIKALIS